MPSKISFRNAKLYKKSKSPRSTPRKNDSKKKPSMVQRVQRLISKNIENKFTLTKTYTAPVGNVINSGTPNIYYYNFFTWAPGAQANATTEQLFNIVEGTAQNQRVGNSIKLKRWIIKGMVAPNIFGQLAPYTALGYVDVYFGRLRSKGSPVDQFLTAFYQNGSTSITPSMTHTDTLNPINKDLYKIYYHKRFKTGSAGVFQQTLLPEPSEPVNNDYKLTHTFGFDVCKFICKDRKITFLDAAATPQDIDLATLTLFATFTPFTGQAYNNITQPNDSLPTYMNMSCTSYAEFEDA